MPRCRGDPLPQTGPGCSGLCTVSWPSCQWPYQHFPVYLPVVLEEVKPKLFPGGIQGLPPLGSQSLCGITEHCCINPQLYPCRKDTHHFPSFFLSSLHTLSPALKILVFSSHLNCANSSKCQLPYNAFHSHSNSICIPSTHLSAQWLTVTWTWLSPLPDGSLMMLTVSGIII